MKTYYVTYLNFQEERVKAASLRVTSKVVTFLEGKVIKFVVPVSEIMRVGETRFCPLDEIETEKAESAQLKQARAWLAENAKREKIDILEKEPKHT